MESVSGQSELQGESQAVRWPLSFPLLSGLFPIRLFPKLVTSQRCPMMGASAHACSVLRPSLPFLKAMSVKDLSNHLWEERQ